MLVACRYDGTVVRLLIERGANVNSKGFNGVHILQMNGHPMFTQQQHTPLHHACRRLHFEGIQLLLENGANINEINKV